MLSLGDRCAAQNQWGSRSLFDKSGPSAPGPGEAAPAGESGGPGSEAKAPVIPKPPESEPLSPDLQNEFLNATRMSVSEYLQRYGEETGATSYKLGPADVLRVKVFDEPELNREDLRVSADGMISLPLIGRLKVEGLTTAAAERKIEKMFREGGYLRQPHVTLAIQEFKSRQVLVMGAVNEPGTHIMEGNERLLEMLSKAGGIKFDPEGDIAANSIRILRTHKGANGKRQRISMEMDLESLTKGISPEFNLVMRDKDVIYVPEAPRFYVTGEVKNPGSYKIKDRPVSVVEAITLAGGPTPTAAVNRTRVVRTEKGEEVTLSIPVDDILSGDKNKDILVKPNDVIVVPQSYF